MGIKRTVLEEGRIFMIPKLAMFYFLKKYIYLTFWVKDTDTGCQKAQKSITERRQIKKDFFP